MNIQNKAAIVTGASRGVGRATALALARGGCNVLVNYRESAKQASETLEAARGFGVQAMTFQAAVEDD